MIPESSTFDPDHEAVFFDLPGLDTLSGRGLRTILAA
jgi:hypothetical protein